MQHGLRLEGGRGEGGDWVCVGAGKVCVWVSVSVSASVFGVSG